MYKPIYYDDSTQDVRRTATEFFTTFPALVKAYLIALFPIFSWLPRYNLKWLSGDLIAGITAGCVVVPQGMSYAQIATLPPQFGLYSSFTGVFIYCFFATSKDITIGPVAVMSQLIAEILAEVKVDLAGIEPQVIAAVLALLAGFTTLLMGLLRLGFIIDFISGPAIAGFMSGSALTIAIGQLAGLFGVSRYVNTKVDAFTVLTKTLGKLDKASADAAVGLTCLFILYAVKYGSEYVAQRFPRYKRIVFFINTSRSVLVVLCATLVAFCVSKDPEHPPIELLGKVPSGLHDIGAQQPDLKILRAVGGRFPVVVLILILEHVAIAKSFGRLNDYVINPNQELIAIGIANILGSFFSSYPATGSFSRTAIKSKAGVRSPLAGIFSGTVVLLAIYALTPVFFYIPKASLSALIIHAVVDLFSGPKTWKQYWQVSPFELLVFLSGVIITFFTTVETGVYVSVSFSLFLLLVRIARPRFSVLGRVPVYTHTRDDDDGKPTPGEPQGYIYVPMDHESLRSTTEILPMPPGVVVIRLEEAYTYPNASFITDKIIDAAKAVTRSGGPVLEKGDRPWNDASNEETMALKAKLPLLKAMVIDFACVNSFDSTALQGLIVARATLDRYAGQPVEWHFANVTHSQIRRSLVSGGFGGVTPRVTDTNPMGMVPGLNTTQTTEPIVEMDVVPDNAAAEAPRAAIGSDDVVQDKEGEPQQNGFHLRNFLRWRGSETTPNKMSPLLRSDPPPEVVKSPEKRPKLIRHREHYPTEFIHIDLDDAVRVASAEEPRSGESERDLSSSSE